MSRDGDRAEAALTDSEQEIGLLVETIPALVWRAEPEGNIEYVNKRALDYFGAPADEILGWGWMDKVHPDDVAFKVKSWLENLQAESPHDVVCRFRGADGRYRWFNIRGEPLRASDGRVLRWYGVLIDIHDRTIAEEALRASEYKLRKIIEAMPGFHWSMGPDGEPTQVNQRVLDYSGMQFDDFSQRGWERFLHPDDFPETAKALYGAIETGATYHAVHRLRRADGEYRWHHATAEPLRDERGRIIQWYGLTIDIDELKTAEDRLRRSETYLAEAQRLSHTGSSVYNDKEILYWTEESSRIWGFDPAEGMPSREAVWRRIHPDDLDRTNKNIAHGVREKKSFANEFRIILADGTVKHIEASNSPVFSASGEFLEILATGIDVTERKRAEQALRESERNLRSAIDGVAGLVVVLGPNGEVETVNRQVLDYFGRSLEWITNWRAEDAVHPEDLPRVVEVFSRAMASGLPYHVDERLRGADGEYRWFEGRGVPVHDDSGRIVRWYILLTDIDDRTRALARLDQMQSDLARMNRLSMMGELAGSLAHEIAQPIAAARNNARAAFNFLDRSPPDRDQGMEALACVVDDADRAGEILDRIRDHLNKAPLRKERVDLNQAIADVIALARGATIRNEVSVKVRLTEGPPHVQADRIQIQQVVLNLVLNAVEAMGSHEAGLRELSIATERDEAGGVLVAVRDSGPGIDAKHLDRVFDAFYTTKSSGVGMGLSICRSIIDAHGGRVWAEANASGGALFQFTLPGADDEHESDHRGRLGATI